MNENRDELIRGTERQDDGPSIPDAAAQLGIDAFSLYSLVQHGSTRRSQPWAVFHRETVPAEIGSREAVEGFNREIVTEGGVMLKRSGELCRYCVPGFAGRLTESEHNLYLEALSVVRKQLLELSDFSRQLDKVAEWCEHGDGKMVSCNGAESILTTPKPPASWKVVNQILKLELGSILFCSHAGGDGQDYAIIQRFLPQSLYAKAHGAIVIQAQGNDPTRLVQEYIERVRHTLRFMASDTVARAQEIIWKKSNGRDVGRVVQAISDQFNEAVAENIGIGQNRGLPDLTANQRNGIGLTSRR